MVYLVGGRFADLLVLLPRVLPGGRLRVVVDVVTRIEATFWWAPPKTTTFFLSLLIYGLFVILS